MTYTLGRGLGSPYIAQRVQHEPLDQTDLRNGVDATLGGGGGTFQKMEARGHQGVPAVTPGLIWNLAHSGPCECYKILWRV
jgi:hypothetical protein